VKYLSKTLSVILCSLFSLAYGQDQIIKIGHVAPTSGAISHLGKDNENGAKLAIEQLNGANLILNGRPVKFDLVLEDDAADPKQATDAAKRLVEAKVNGVIGHLNSGTSIPASRIYDQAGIPQISPSSTNPKLTRQGYSGTFRMLANDEQLGQILGKFASQTLFGRRIAIIDDQTAYGTLSADAFEKGAKESGANIISRRYISAKDSDFSSTLTLLKAEGAEVLFFGGMDVIAAPMIRQIDELGLKVTFIGGDGICSSSLAKMAGNSINKVRVFCAESGGIEKDSEARMFKFRTNYKAKFGTDVQVYAPYVYDAIYVMVQAMINVQSPEPAKYLPALKAINYKGITGNVAFDQNGDNKSGTITILTFIDGKREILSIRR
jgi:branched-chain amino acid transport system substrate-binding protein